MAKKIKKALVTGGAGFIGSHIVDALIKRRIKVVVVDDLSSGSKKNVNPNAKLMKMSITSPQFPTLLKNVKPDIIFHCAAQKNLRDSITDPMKDAKANILGTLALVQYAKDSKLQKIVFSSTGGALYPVRPAPPHSEKIAVDPPSPYGISKHCGEKYLAFMHQMYGVPYVALRYANVYGPRQDAKGEAGVVALFSDAMLRGKSVKIFGSGKQTRDFVYIDDIVRANMLAMRSKVTGVFNIGTGKQTNVNELFKKLNALTGGELPKRHAPAVDGELMKSALDARKAKRLLGWVPKVKLDEGLLKTVNWFKKTM